MRPAPVTVPSSPGAERPQLVALPAQPAGVPWPTREWPAGSPPWRPALDELLEDAFDDGGPLATTYAVLVVHGGMVVAERYGGSIGHVDGPPETVGAGSTLLSWSMAKSVLHAAVGVLVGDGSLSCDEAAPVPQWSDPGDPRHAITVEQLLTMRDGLCFVEDYVDDRISDVIHMLFGEGRHDVAAFAADRPLQAAPGARFNYSSGSSNVLSGVVSRTVGPGDAVASFLAGRLFGPIGATSATVTVDDAGTWVASSYLHATARDFARLGYLYLRDGVWEGHRLLPAGWVDHGRLPRSVDEDGLVFGAHWWVVGDRHGSFAATGYEGQQIVVSPGLDTVVVRLGKTPTDRYPVLRRWRADVLDAVAGGLGR